jgi:hypothetical protein
MKTPREILLERHHAAGSRLDGIRNQALASLVQTPDPQPERRPLEILRGFFREYRRHFAGMAALWTVVALLNLTAGRSSGPVAAIPRDKIPSPQVILVSLRENRRVILELIQPPEPRYARPSRLFLLHPRREARDETLAA